MKYEVVDNEIVFDVETEQLGKGAIIDAIQQVLFFWNVVRFYRVFRRQPFDSIIIKITRDNFMETIRENNDTLHRTKIDN